MRNSIYWRNLIIFGGGGPGAYNILYKLVYFAILQTLSLAKILSCKPVGLLQISGFLYQYLTLAGFKVGVRLLRFFIVQILRYIQLT